jgi:hypothetical protein
MHVLVVMNMEFFYLATIISTMLVMSVLVMPAMSCAAIEDYFL